MDIHDHVFVVTGGGDGIGRALVTELIERGARVAAVDLHADALEATRSAVARPEAVLPVQLDVTDRAAVAGLPEQVVSHFGQVDGLINNAGIIQPFVAFGDLSDEQITRVMEVNFWGVVHLCRAFLPVLHDRPEASLVNVASMGAFVPVPGQSVYGASKAAVKLLTEGLYAELRGTSIAVTTVFPGGVATSITDNSGVAMPGAERQESDRASKLTSAPDAARQIADAVAGGRPRLVIGRDARLLDRLSRLMPRRSVDLVAKKMADLVS